MFRVACVLGPEVGGGRIDDVQHGNARSGRHILVPAMRGVAGNGDRAAPGGYQPVNPAQQPRQRVGAAGEFSPRAVGHTRVGPEYGRDMILIARRRRQKGQPQHELRAGQWPHAAQYAQNPVIRHAAVRLECASWQDGRQSP